MAFDIDAIKQGDAAALARCFDDLRGRLRRTIQFRLDVRLVSRIDVDDVLQEAFMNASTRTAHIKAENEQELFIWFRLIVMQTLIDTHRRHIGAKMRDAGREAQPTAGAGYSTSLSMTHRLIGHLTTPTQSLRRVEAQEKMETALSAMNEIDREVLALRHFEELSNQEVAGVLGIEAKAASIRYVRALRRLKEIMESLPGYEPSGQ
ncbi:MAG: sigma-70 family RNA polymerase sigma factor [Phycisphaerae bacterium]